MDDTIDEIVKASTLPLSIIIVGIGNESFEKMVILDGDENPLTNRNGVKRARDIVQFVPFRDFKNADINRLAEEVLQEVPTQIVSYMNANKIKPNERLKKESFLDFKKDQKFNSTKDLNIDLNIDIELNKKENFTQYPNLQNQTQFGSQFTNNQGTNNTLVNGLNIGINNNLSNEGNPNLKQYDSSQQINPQFTQTFQNQNQFQRSGSLQSTNQFQQFGTFQNNQSQQFGTFQNNNRFGP